jgi:hypothetical protein
MRLEDLTLEVRDRARQRVGQLVGADLVGAQFVLRFNNVGSWRLRLPATSILVDALRTPGFGVLLTGPDGVLMSGPVLSAKLVQTQDDIEGAWEIEGADDSLILQERLAYPEPSNPDVETQTVSNDIRVGAAETLIKGYVDSNLVSGPTVRQVDGLTIAADLGRGATVRGNARFKNIQELLYDLAQSGGLGYDVRQVGTDLVLDVYEPVDRSADVRLDIENNRLRSSEYAYSAPLLTRAIVAGAGEAIERVFREVDTSESSDAETVWNRRIESFIDDRGTEEVAQLDQKGLEALVDDGKTRVTMSVTPSDNLTMLYGVDWNLGDTVTVVVNNLEATAVVYEVGLAIQPDGVYLAATVGNPTPLEFESRLSARQENHESRISNLERNTTGYGITTVFEDVQGGTDDVQPTFSGPVFDATYTRFGNMVHFAYEVDFDNITSFGTGQYFMTLPYNSARNYQFRDGCLHDISAGLDYHISGHVVKGSNVMTLNTTGIQGQRIFDDPFTSTTPATLAVEDNFHIAGTYEIEV